MQRDTHLFECMRKPFKEKQFQFIARKTIFKQYENKKKTLSIGFLFEITQSKGRIVP